MKLSELHCLVFTLDKPAIKVIMPISGQQRQQARDTGHMTILLADLVAKQYKVVELENA